jgi:DNA-binding YbaB/EbfC family protein
VAPTDDDHPIRPDAVSPSPTGLPVGGAELAGGGLDMGALFEQAAKMQEQLLAAQQQAADTEVEGVAGGGVVKVRVTGAMEFLSVEIDPSAVDPNDVEMLQDLVLAALHDATARVQELQSGSMDLGGIDLGGLLGDG